VIYSIKDVLLGRPACPAEITNYENERVWVENHIAKFKDHPALLAWYINDELGPEWIDRLKVRYDLVKRADPDHPAFMVLYQIGRLREYAGTFDIMGTDPYPVAGKEPKPISMVADWTARTRKNVFGKAVWEAPQIFDWSAYRKFPGVTTRAPTEAEIKNMVWQCVAAGANGVCAYNYNGLRIMNKRDPFDKRWAEVCRAYGEFAKYVPVFLSSEPAPVVSGAPNGVYVRSWVYKGKTWLLAINTTDITQNCTLFISDNTRVDVQLPPLAVDMRML
jgi:hypothetical protein